MTCCTVNRCHHDQPVSLNEFVYNLGKHRAVLLCGSGNDDPNWQPTCGPKYTTSTRPPVSVSISTTRHRRGSAIVACGSKSARWERRSPSNPTGGNNCGVPSGAYALRGNRSSHNTGERLFAVLGNL